MTFPEMIVSTCDSLFPPSFIKGVLSLCSASDRLVPFNCRTVSGNYSSAISSGFNCACFLHLCLKLSNIVPVPFILPDTVY